MAKSFLGIHNRKIGFKCDRIDLPATQREEREREVASHTNIVGLEMECLLEPRKTTEVKLWASTNLAVFQTKYYLLLKMVETCTVSVYNTCVSLARPFW